MGVVGIRRQHEHRLGMASGRICRVTIHPVRYARSRYPEHARSGRRVCHQRSLGPTPYEGKSMEDVRFFPADITHIHIICRVGRVDDVLILANGEKVVPGPTEGALLVHPFVHSAVMFGRERTQVGILVEPAESHVFDPADESALAAFRNAIWTTVEEANSTLPAFGRLYKEMILVTHPSKPLPRVAKGTVNRKAALREYEEEINAMLVPSSYHQWTGH